MAADPLGPNQERFSARLAKLTGLNLDVVRAWVHAEQPYDSPATGQMMPYNDWLNIGWTSAGRAQITYAPDWASPDQAAARTAEWLQGTWGDQYGYRAAPSIRGILKAAGESPAQQIEAIQQSGWASSGYPALVSSYNAVRGSSSNPLGGTPAGPFVDPITGSTHAVGSLDRPGAGSGGGIFGWLVHGAESAAGDIEHGAESLWNDVNSVTDFLKALLWLINPLTWLRAVEGLFGFALLLAGVLVMLGADKGLANAGPVGGAIEGVVDTAATAG